MFTRSDLYKKLEACFKSNVDASGGWLNSADGGDIDALTTAHFGLIALVNKGDYHFIF